MVRDWLWGPMSPVGLGVAAATALLDQAHKAWMLYVYDIGAKGVVTITPFFDLVLVWNQGISYGLLPQASALGRFGLIGFAFAASLALAVFAMGVLWRLSFESGPAGEALAMASEVTAAGLGSTTVKGRCGSNHFVGPGSRTSSAGAGSVGRSR